MRVLMATMQLDIGGAETHIVELSKALKRRGVEVFVASNGGAYVAELEEAGITHFKVALHSKSPKALYSAYKKLERIILDNRIDVVHAHARIPGFLCGLLQSRHKFRFVTTAHWVFNTAFPLNLLTDWGDRSLAVSDDIKDYLIKNYGCSADNIRVTINGIDTDKFSDSTDYSDIKNEFSFGENKTRITYVSRMDTDRSFAAHKLIEATPALYEKIPSLEIVIVGGGNDYEAIKAEAEAMNSRLKSRIIITTGSRTDINKFVAAADAFVGVSRAALEAMAAKKPAVIAGNEGYIGVFSEEKLGVSIDTNFCCRGCGETTAEKLEKDILYILCECSAEKRKALGEYSFETVKKYYSVDTMADDAIKMYISIIKNSLINEVDISEFDDIDRYLVHRGTKRDIDVMISGYYGFHNSGDDSILRAIINSLRAECPNLKIVVLSKSPEETRRIYGVDSLDRFNLPKIYALMRRTRLLISGGGSLIQDVTSSKSLYYYLAIMKMAKRAGARIMLYANGIGPIKKSTNIKKVQETLALADEVTLRENASASELKKLSPAIKPIVTADPVFTLKPETGGEAERILKASGLKEGQRFFIVAVRSWRENPKDMAKRIADFCENVYKTHKVLPLIMPMQPSFDTEVSENIEKLLTCPHMIITKSFAPSVMLSIVGKAEFVLGMRLHTLIYAARMGVPVIALEYDPKISAIMAEIGQSCTQSIKSLDENKLLEYADNIMKNRSELCGKLERISENQARLAARNTEIVIKLLNEN